MVSRKPDHIHGYIIMIGSLDSPKYFHGSGYSTYKNEAKVFRTKAGAKHAYRIWENASYNPTPLSKASRWSMRISPVGLILLQEQE